MDSRKFVSRSRPCVHFGDDWRWLFLINKAYIAYDIVGKYTHYCCSIATTAGWFCWARVLSVESLRELNIKAWSKRERKYGPRICVHTSSCKTLVAWWAVSIYLSAAAYGANAGAGPLNRRRHDMIALYTFTRADCDWKHVLRTEWANAERYWGTCNKIGFPCSSHTS